MEESLHCPQSGTSDWVAAADVVLVTSVVFALVVVIIVVVVAFEVEVLTLEVLVLVAVEMSE